MIRLLLLLGALGLAIPGAAAAGPDGQKDPTATSDVIEPDAEAFPPSIPDGQKDPTATSSVIEPDEEASPPSIPNEQKDPTATSSVIEPEAKASPPSIPDEPGPQPGKSGESQDSSLPGLREPLVPEPGKSKSTALTEELFNEYSESAPPSKKAVDEARDEAAREAEPDEPTKEQREAPAQPASPVAEDSEEEKKPGQLEDASEAEPADVDKERQTDEEQQPDEEPNRKVPPRDPVDEASDEPAPEQDARTQRDEVIEEISQDAPPARRPTPESPPPSPLPSPPPAEPEPPSSEKEKGTTDGGQEEEPKERPSLRIWLDRGLRIERNPDHFRLKIGGRLFIDGAHIGGDEFIREQFETGGFGGVRQARIDFTGTVGSRIYYKFQVDVTGESASDLSEEGYLKYFFVGVTGLGPLGRAEVGIIKEPISMSMLTSGLNVDFQERALPTVFAPSWNVGFVLRNEVFDNQLSWTFGVFRGDDAAGSEDTPVDITGRLATVLWSKEDGSRFVHVGASYKLETGGRFNVQYKSRPETSFGDDWVDTGSFPAKRSHVVGFELAGLLQPISFQSEILASFVERDSAPNVRFWGAYLQVSYFLTGERRHYLRRQRVFGRVQLNHPFSWKAKTWGAFELTGRYSYLSLDSRDIRGGSIHNTTLGLNWYILPNVRIITNYIHSRLNGAESGNIGSVRFQIDY